MSEFMNIQEVCSVLNLGKGAVYNLCRQGRIPGAAKVGGQWRVDPTMLVAWMDEGRPAHPESAPPGEGTAKSPGGGNGAPTALSDGRNRPSATPRLRPFFGYYGGKWRDAIKHYPAPEHHTIVEPFAGSAGYSLRYADRKVILCERDPILVAVWKFLIAATPSEIRSIKDVPLDGSVDDLRISQEARWLVGFWMNRGAARPRKSPSKWMRDGIRPGSFWGDRVRETIASQVDAIRHWEIHECSYEDCPYDGPATWFIDPPYQQAGKHYHYGSDTIKYGDLASWCMAREGHVLVCENEGAEWLQFKPLAEVKTTRRGNRSKEVIWSNRPIKPLQGRLLEDRPEV